MNLCQHVKVLDFKQGFMTLNLASHLPKNFIIILKEKIFKLTGQLWIIEIKEEEKGVSIFQQEEQNLSDLKQRFKELPSIKKLLQKFPDAVIEVTSSSS